MVSTGGVRKHEVSVQGSFGNMSRGGGGINACPRGLQVRHALVQGRCNQIDACSGCTLKPVPEGVDKTDTCQSRGDFTYCTGRLRSQLLSSVCMSV